MCHIAATHPRVTKAWADTGYRTKATDPGIRLGIDVEVQVVQREPGVKGFKVIPRAESSSAPSAASFITAVWPATTRPTLTAPKP